MSDDKLIEVRLPGSAYQVLTESDIPQHEPDLWKRITSMARKVRRGQGIQCWVRANVDDLNRLADYFFHKADLLASMSREERGSDGYATLRSSRIAMTRIEHALEDAARRGLIPQEQVRSP